MREKYLKNEGLLQAKLGGGPSNIWRNLWSSLELVKEWRAWRVGDGSTVHIWLDKWLPNHISPRLQSPVKNMPSVSKVNQLINSGDGTWKRGLINDTFSKEEAKLICSIPICEWGVVDKII